MARGLQLARGLHVIGGRQFGAAEENSLMTHTRSTRTGPVWNHARNEPAVEQPSLWGWAISWNPDDGRWYVDWPDDRGTRITFRERRNLVQWTRKNPLNTHNP